MTRAAPDSRPDNKDAVDRRAMVATYVAFGAAGVAFSSWISRLPQIRDGLQLDPSQLGLVLVAVAVGSMLSLPLSGPLIARVGTAQLVKTAATLFLVALATVAVGYRYGVIPVVVGLFGVGLSVGAWDVAINVQGARVEQHLGRSIMSRFHAGFSLGTVTGALVGAGMVALEVSPTIHLTLAAAVASGSVLVAARHFLGADDGAEGDTPARTDAADQGSGPTTPKPRGALAAWREPRTVLIGVMVLAFAFAEGVANDWIAIALIDGHGAPEALGTLGLSVFLAAMTVARWFGPGLLDRYGRVAVLRVIATLGIAGSAVFVAAPTILIAMVGVALWGLGASLGFPVGMSAGADDPVLAPGRVSVISSIGYGAFLSGPPLIGFLGDRFTVVSALTVVPVVLILAVVLAPRVRQEPAPVVARALI